MPEHLENTDFTFFAADENFTRNTWEMARQSGSDIVDLSYALENEKGVPLRAPWIERELGKSPTLEFGQAAVTIAHPAAVVLALLLLRAQKIGPISARGDHGAGARLRTRQTRHGRTARANREPAVVPADAQSRV